MAKRQNQAKQDELVAEYEQVQELFGKAFQRWRQERWPHRVRRRLDAIRRLVQDEVQRGRYPRRSAENDNHEETPP